MLQRVFTPMTIALLSGGLLLSPLRAAESKVQTDGFSHVARISTGADLSSIRFEKARMVKVPARIKQATDPAACPGTALKADPEGNIPCPNTTAPVAAYEVTYSYTGEPLASDEYGSRYFTFRVYVRADELSADAQKALSGGKLSRSDRAAYFAVSTHRESVMRDSDGDKQSRPYEYVAVRVEPLTAAQRVERARVATVK